MSKRTDSPGLGSVGSGALTAVSLLVVSALAAVVGVVIAREFGRSDQTDGLLAAYGVFIVIAIAAQALRVAVLPELARARQDERLAGELAGIAVALGVVAGPLVLLAVLAGEPLATLLTGGDAELARDTAADALGWIVPAAIAHLFAAVAASGLAALDDYATAAAGYIVGAVAGLTFILLRVEPDGIVAIPQGMLLNSVLAVTIPTIALVARATRARMPRTAVRPSGPPLSSRLGRLAVAVSLPLTLQLLYLVCLPFAARLGTGAATSFVYAYLAAASLVMVTAASLGLVTSVPLTRAGLEPTRTAGHVVAASWVALALIGAAAGVVALAGGDLVEAVLGAAYAGDVGAELGRLVVLLAPWMIATVGISVTFPLTFVVERTRRLPWIALGALSLQVPLAWLGRELLELDGLALALAVPNFVVLVALLVELDAFSLAARGLLAAAGIVGVLAVVAFAPPALILGSGAAAAVGLALYLALFAVVRPRGLGTSWRYLRTLA